MFEGTDISVGRGTYKPFQQIGHPTFTTMSYSFTPVAIEGMSKYPKHQDQRCYGVLFNSKNAVKGFSITPLLSFYQLFADKSNFFTYYFNTLAGNSTLQEQIVAGNTEQEIVASWQKELDLYKTKRKKYLLYPDFE